MFWELRYCSLKRDCPLVQCDVSRVHKIRVQSEGRGFLRCGHLRTTEEEVLQKQTSEPSFLLQKLKIFRKLWCVHADNDDGGGGNGV